MWRPLELADQDETIAHIATLLRLDAQTVKRTTTSARRFAERRVFLPAGLEPVGIYADARLAVAARHRRLTAVRFARRWYTTDRCVYEI